MEILWYHSGTRHWREEGEDWLCAYKSKHDKATRIIFCEDTHHFCKELYTERGGQMHPVHRLDGPGPFEVELSVETECWLYVRIHFFAYRRNPSQSSDVYSVQCAEIHDERGIESADMFIAGTTGASRTPVRVMGIDDVKRHITNKALARPELRRGNSKQIPFHLEDAMVTETRVFLFGASDVQSGIEPGKVVPLSKFGSSPHTIIPAGQMSPRANTGIPDWTVALPVSVRPGDTVLVGEPLVHGALISNLKIEPLAPRIEVFWKWSGPRQWMAVRLKWCFFITPGGDDDFLCLPDTDYNFVGERDVMWAEFSLRNSIELLNYNTFRNEIGIDLRGWNILVTATPLLFGLEPPGGNQLEAITDL